MKKRIARYVAVICAVVFLFSATSCRSSEQYFQRHNDKNDNPLIYLTGSPQELSDQIFEMISATKSTKEMKELFSEWHNNFLYPSEYDRNQKNLDGEKKDVVCTILRLRLFTSQESGNGCYFYELFAVYEYRMGGEKYVCRMDALLRDEYEFYKQGLINLEVIPASEYTEKQRGLDLLHGDPMEVFGESPVLDIVNPLYALHHEDVMKHEEYMLLPESQALMEEILYICEQGDKDALLCLYSEEHVFIDKDDYRQNIEEQADLLIDLLDEEGLSAVGTIVNWDNFYWNTDNPNYDKSKKAFVYSSRYMVTCGSEKYHIQVDYLMDADDAEQKHIGVQGIYILEE